MQGFRRELSDQRRSDLQLQGLVARPGDLSEGESTKGKHSVNNFHYPSIESTVSVIQFLLRN
jgi:hypothetical protein